MTMSASLNAVYNEQKAMISSISRPQQHGLMDEQVRGREFAVVEFTAHKLALENFVFAGKCDRKIAGKTIFVSTNKENFILSALE